jgi:hypothetical protein
MSRSRAYRPSLRAVGLTWTVLLGAVTAAVAQTRSDSPAPPVRLPGVVYPGDAAVTARDPKLKPKGQRAGSSLTERRSRSSHTRDRAPR